MIKKPNGGPAFPAPPTGISAGMSLRDWFAGQALSGLVAGGDALYKHTVQEIASDVYQMADAMLTERK